MPLSPNDQPSEDSFHPDAFRDPDLARSLVARIQDVCRKPMAVMEVCGTHTVAIFRHGIRTLLPDTLRLISGPGCPVCVTAQGDIDAFVALARQPGTIVTTFGDLVRVPGSGSSLQHESAGGADVRMVYSPLDAVAVAREHPESQVVFLGVGFETTVPTVAAAILAADQEGLSNFSVYCAHKTVPIALEALMGLPDMAIEGFLLPGHVSVIIGLDGYRPFFDNHRVPAVIAGFEPIDILNGIAQLAGQIAHRQPALTNAYPRVVSDAGNAKARAIIESVFEPCDAHWRGIGVIPASGLAIRKDFVAFDAQERFGIRPEPGNEPPGCACGRILTGMAIPPDCALYGRACTPTAPVGPCMVSSEGTCAAYFRYHDSGTRDAGT